MVGVNGLPQIIPVRAVVRLISPTCISVPAVILTVMQIFLISISSSPSHIKSRPPSNLFWVSPKASYLLSQPLVSISIRPFFMLPSILFFKRPVTLSQRAVSAPPAAPGISGLSLTSLERHFQPFIESLLLLSPTPSGICKLRFLRAEVDNEEGGPGVEGLWESEDLMLF